MPKEEGAAAQEPATTPRSTQNTHARIQSNHDITAPNSPFNWGLGANLGVLGKPPFWRLLFKDLSRMLTAWGTLTAIAILVLVDGALFWLIGSSVLMVYLLASYVVLPIFLLPYVAGGVSSERQSGFIETLFTTPLSRGRYLSLRFMTGLAMALLFFLLKLPFAALLLYSAGIGWLPVLASFWTLYTFYATFMVSLGLLISVLVGSKGLKVAIFVSIGLIFLYLFSPAGTLPQYMGALSPELQDSFLRLLHFSPVFDALSFLDAYLPVTAIRAESPLLVLIGMSVSYVLLSAVTFRWLQIPAGWNARTRTRVLMLTFVIGISALIPLALAPEYRPRQEGVFPRGTSYVEIESFGTVGSLSPHQTHEGELTLAFYNCRDERLVYHNLTVTFLPGNLVVDSPEFTLRELWIPGKPPAWSACATKSLDIPMSFRLIRALGLSSANLRFDLEVRSEELSETLNLWTSGIGLAGYDPSYSLLLLLLSWA
ncbi:MAG: ABC transporter permease [Thermoplasmata archaeon]